MVFAETQSNFHYFLMMTRLQRIMVALRHELHSRVFARKLQQAGKGSFFQKRKRFVLHRALNSFHLTNAVHRVGVETGRRVVIIHVLRRLVSGEAPPHRIVHVPVAVVEVRRMIISTVRQVFTFPIESGDVQVGYFRQLHGEKASEQLEFPEAFHNFPGLPMVRHLHQHYVVVMQKRRVKNVAVLIEQVEKVVAAEPSHLDPGNCNDGAVVHVGDFLQAGGLFRTAKVVQIPAVVFRIQEGFGIWIKVVCVSLVC